MGNWQYAIGKSSMGEVLEIKSPRENGQLAICNWQESVEKSGSMGEVLEIKRINKLTS